jgi:hypothetical protein
MQAGAARVSQKLAPISECNRHFAICTPTLMSKADLRPQDLCLVDLEGKQLAGGRPRTSEILMHLAGVGANAVRDVAAVAIDVSPLPELCPDVADFFLHGFGFRGSEQVMGGAGGNGLGRGRRFVAAAKRDAVLYDELHAEGVTKALSLSSNSVVSACAALVRSPRVITLSLVRSIDFI